MGMEEETNHEHKQRKNSNRKQNKRVGAERRGRRKARKIGPGGKTKNRETENQRPRLKWHQTWQ